MNIKNIIILLLTLFLTCSIAFGQQTLEIFSLSGQFSPANIIDNHSGKADITDGVAFLTLPVPFEDDKNIWYTNFTYLFSDVSTSMSPADPAVVSTRLQGVILRTGIIRKLDDKHALQLLLAPRFMTGSNWQSTDVQPGVVALFEKRYNPALRMRYGVMYNQDLFGPMIIPLVDVYYQQADSRWTFSGLLPIKSKISYRVNSNLSVGMQHLGLVTSYPLAAQGAGYMERKSIDLSLFSQYRLARNIHAELKLGYALEREYAQYADDDKLDARIAVIEIGAERTRLNPSVSDGFFGGLRLFYQIVIDKQ